MSSIFIAEVWLAFPGAPAWLADTKTGADAEKFLVVDMISPFWGFQVGQPAT